MRRPSTESSKEPKGILKTQTKYGIPTSPSSQHIPKQGQSKYESILRQHGDSVLKKEIEQRSLQQKSLQNINQNNSSFHNKSNASIGSAKKNSFLNADNASTVKRPSIQQQQAGALNYSAEQQRRSSRLNDQILENSQGSRLALQGQSPLNINSSHIMNNSVHAYLNNQNQITNLQHSPHQQPLLGGGAGGGNSAAATLNQIFNQVTLKDLCPEDKRKVGQLMKKLAEEKQEKELLKQKLQLNENVYKERLNYIQKENQQIQENTNVLKDRFQQSVKLLQNIRDRSADRNSPSLNAQQITPQHNHQINYDSNFNSQPTSQQQRKSLNRSLNQLANNIGDQDLSLQQQQQNLNIQGQLNKSNQDIPVSSFNNFQARDTPEDQQQLQQLRQSDLQIASNSVSHQAIKQEDIDDEDRMSRNSRQSRQDNKQNQQQISNQNNPFNSKQSTIQNNMFPRNNNSNNNNNNNNSNSSRNLNQLQQVPYMMDSLDQEVQEFLSQSIPNMASRRATELEQQLNNVVDQNMHLRSSLSPISSQNQRSYPQSTGGLVISGGYAQQQLHQNSMHLGSISSPVHQQQIQAPQPSFSKYIYKNGQNDPHNSKYISNNELLKNKSQLRYSLSSNQLHQNQGKHNNTQGNVQSTISFQQSSNINKGKIDKNNDPQAQQERVPLRMHTGESEKMFNQWKKQYATNTADDVIVNSPYKNKPFFDRAKQIEEDDTQTFQEISNLRSQMQGLVTSLKQLSFNKQSQQPHDKVIEQNRSMQNSNKKSLQKDTISSEGPVASKLLQGEIHSISSRNVDSVLSNRQSENVKNTVKSTLNSQKENRKRTSNMSQETFAQLPLTSHHHSSTNSRASQRQDTLQNKEPKYKNKFDKYNSSEENSSEDDDQIEIAQKFLNLKKQKLLSHLQDIRKDDFLDSSSFEQSQLFDKSKHSQKQGQKSYDLPLQILHSETNSNMNISTSYNNDRHTKFNNKYLQNLYMKEGKHSPSNQQGERSFISPPSHVNNYHQGGQLPYTLTTNQILSSTSRKSSPQLHLLPNVGNIDSHRGTSNPETLTRVTSRNITSTNRNNGVPLTSGGEIVGNAPLNIDNMSKEEIKRLNRMLERKLREMSESVSYEISSQNNELDVSEQIHNQQLLPHHINTPLRQSQNTNTFELSNTQIQIHSLKDSELLKYSNATGQGIKVKGNNSIQNIHQQKSQAQINYYNPQSHNIHNSSGVGSNNLGSQRSTHNQNQQNHREQTNPTNPDEYITFRHEDQDRGDTKRTVEYNNKERRGKQNNSNKNGNNNNHQQNGLDESKGTDAVRVTENFSYLSTPQPEKLQIDLASTAKRDIQENLQLMSSGEKSDPTFSHKNQEDSNYIKVEDGKGRKSHQSESAKQAILSKIQHLSEEEMVQVLEALKQKKASKRSAQQGEQEESTYEYQQEKGLERKQGQQNKEKYQNKIQVADGDDEGEDESGYMSAQQQEDVDQDNYEDIYNDISREQRDSQNDSHKLHKGFNQQNKINTRASQNKDQDYRFETEKSQPYSKLTTIKQSNESMEDVLGINDLIHNNINHHHLHPPQPHKQSQQNSASSTPQNQREQNSSRLRNDHSNSNLPYQSHHNASKQSKDASTKSIKSGVSKGDAGYDESLFQNIQTIEKHDFSKRTLSSKSSKGMITHKDDQQNRSHNESKLENINEQGFHMPKQYSRTNTEEQEKRQKRALLYQSDGIFDGEEDIPRRIDEGLIRKSDEKYCSSSYTETDQSIKYIKRKIENQI